MKLVSAKQMRNIDAISINKYKIPGIILMENAGRVIADITQKELKNKKRCIVFCGSGNNGGDGLVAARYLFNRGYKTEIVLVKNANKYKGDPKTNFEIIKKLKIPVKKYSDKLKINTDIIIDALLGTGTKGEISGIYKTVIDKINNSKKPVISADIPSGLDADTGKSLGTTIKAKHTVTMGLVKRGLIRTPAKKFTGKLLVAEIGIPKQLL